MNIFFITIYSIIENCPYPYWGYWKSTIVHRLIGCRMYFTLNTRVNWRGSSSRDDLLSRSFVCFVFHHSFLFANFSSFSSERVSNRKWNHIIKSIIIPNGWPLVLELQLPEWKETTNKKFNSSTNPIYNANSHTLTAFLFLLLFQWHSVFDFITHRLSYVHCAHWNTQSKQNVFETIDLRCHQKSNTHTSKHYNISISIIDFWIKVKWSEASNDKIHFRI